MAYTSGFFDAVDQGGGNYDRVYNSSVFAHYFSLLIGNGVFPNPSTGMQVKASSSPDMHVSISPGSGWINGYYITVTENFPEDLTVATANPTLNRIDSVIMGLNLTDREVQLYIKSGAVSSDPVAPSLQRDTDLYELELAQIYVGAGVASILQENITDMRMDSSRCGIVSGTVDQIDTTDLFAQFTDAFNTWFDGLKSELSGDVVTNLQNQINNLRDTKAVTATYTVSVPLSWTENSSGTGYYQTVSVAGILSTDTPLCDIILGSDLEANTVYKEAWGYIDRIVTSDGSITLYTGETAVSSAFTMQVKVVR